MPNGRSYVSLLGSEFSHSSDLNWSFHFTSPRSSSVPRFDAKNYSSVYVLDLSVFISFYQNVVEIMKKLPGIVLSKKQPITPARNILVLRRTVMTWLNSWLAVFT